jgi:hypothetical protein
MDPKADILSRHVAEVPWDFDCNLALGNAGELCPVSNWARLFRGREP